VTRNGTQVSWTAEYSQSGQDGLSGQDAARLSHSPARPKHSLRCILKIRVCLAMNGGHQSSLSRSIWYPSTCLDHLDHTLLQGTEPAERPLLLSIDPFSFHQLYLGSLSSCLALAMGETVLRLVPVWGKPLQSQPPITQRCCNRVFIKLTWHDRGPDQDGGPVRTIARLALCLRCMC